MEYSKELSDNLQFAFLAVSNLRTALYDVIDTVHRSGNTEAIDRLLKASDHLRIIDNTVNDYSHKMTEALLKELA